VIQKSTSLEYEPSSEPLFITAPVDQHAPSLSLLYCNAALWGGCLTLTHILQINPPAHTGPPPEGGAGQAEVIRSCSLDEATPYIKSTPLHLTTSTAHRRDEVTYIRGCISPALDHTPL